MSTTNTAATPAPATGSAQGTVRRLIVYTILFVLVTITAIGVAQLLERLLPGTDLVRGSDGLALSLSFALIGGPLGAVLWWVVWRRLADAAERASLAWGLYVAAMYTVSLIGATSALLGAATAGVSGRWQPGSLATGVVWAAVWAWHRWMWRHPRKGPIRLATVPAVAGSVYGLVVGVGGAVTALGSLFGAAIRGALGSAAALAGAPVWQAPVEALLWALAGGAIWWWHWYRDAAKDLRTGLSAVALVVVGVLGAGVLGLGGLGTALFVLLRLAFDPGDPPAEILGPLGTAIAAASVGALVWWYHRRIAVRRSEATRRAGTLVMAAVGLAAAASGIGVILNATLAALASPLAASDTRSLLLGGISALVVGGPVWWFSWRPARSVPPTEVAGTGRRVYLVAVFGVSAVVALVALLVVGYRLFEFALDSTSGASLVDRIRAPLGLLVATALVFVYHFAVWRRDRAVIAAEGLAPQRRIGRVILVAAGDAAPLEQEIERVTGASVTVWQRVAETDPAAEVESEPDAAAVVAALEGVTAKRVLVVAGPDGRAQVIRLAD